MLRLTVEFEKATPEGSRTATWSIEENGWQFEEQENGVLMLYKGENLIHKINPMAWQTYSLEVIDD